MKQARSDNPRLAAVRMLTSVLDDRNNLTEADTENRQQSPRDRAFARHLSYGVLRWLTALEWISAQLLRKPLRRKDRDIQRLILIGLYQLWKEDGAEHAATHETAECARKLGKPWAVSVINAVLRRFKREQAEICAKLETLDEIHAHPGWLLDALKEDWPDDWERIASANQQPGPLWLRLNCRFNIPETLEILSGGGFNFERHATLEHAIKIIPAVGVSLLPGFAEGRFSVQDPAAQLATGMLQLEEHHHVLDACAAPGGKTCHILEQVPGVNLTAIDQSASRLKRVEENLKRLGFSGSQNLKLVADDAAQPDSWWDNVPFDRILLDAPCSATGVIRRHPEIKWLRSPQQVQEASLTQARLLNQLWSLLKPGGILVYATCSVLRLENNRQIQSFLETHPDAEAKEFDAPWGSEQSRGRQILPGEQEMDGFYYGRLQKKT
jgi:16S rRNA (cytosine967-C5)-methyltransferase